MVIDRKAINDRPYPTITTRYYPLEKVMNAAVGARSSSSDVVASIIRDVVREVSLLAQPEKGKRIK